MPQDDQPGMYDRACAAPDETGVLANNAISALSDRRLRTDEGARQLVLDHLERALLRRGEFDAVQTFAELRDYRLTVDAIVDLYVPAAARSLGQSWVDDTISFADVTIGSLRLQSLLDETASHPCVDTVAKGKRLRALVVLPQGEQHFLGVSVVATQLRRMGCDVSISFDEPLPMLEQRVNQSQPGIVLISASRWEAVDTIKEVVALVRSAATPETLVALGGAVILDAVDLQERTGVDIVTGSAKEAVALCTKRASVQARL